MAQPNGPRNPATRGRNRNTTTNNNSRNKKNPLDRWMTSPQYDRIKRRGKNAMLSPTEVLALNNQLQDLEVGKSDALANLWIQRRGTIRDFRRLRQDTRQMRQEGIQDVSMDALERGISGSTVDFHQRQGVHSEADQALARGETDKNEALAANLLARYQTKRDYRLGVSGVEQARTAQVAEANIERYEQDGVEGLGVRMPSGGLDYSVPSTSGGSGSTSGAGGTGGMGGAAGEQYNAYTNTINNLLKTLQNTPSVDQNGLPNRSRIGLEQRLYDLWEKRNSLLVSAGQDPYRRRVLRRRIARIGG